MFENLVNQRASYDICSDIKRNLFPASVLYSGEHASGKLTAALETARVLSCKSASGKKAHWTCECISCQQHRALVCSNLLVLGPRDCYPEIAAAKSTFIKAYRDNEKYISAARYLFLRSVRKLLLRFNIILWQGESNLSKISSVIEDINDSLELLDYPKNLPVFDETTKLCEKITAGCLKLESEYLYDSIPISQIRNMEEWAQIRSEAGKKTIIIENADRMQTSVRNALLKILEEPPADCIFILLTDRKNAVMPTILSRVRNYSFAARTIEQQKGVISRVFHNDYFNGRIDEYLMTYLPVPANVLREEAGNFYENLFKGSIPDSASLIKRCGNFEPRIELKIFLNSISEKMRGLMKTPEGCEAVSQSLKVLLNCWDNITLYNQSSLSAFEILIRDLSKINSLNNRIFTNNLK